MPLALAWEDKDEEERLRNLSAAAHRKDPPASECGA